MFLKPFSESSFGAAELFLGGMERIHPAHSQVPLLLGLAPVTTVVVFAAGDAGDAAVFSAGVGDSFKRLTKTDDGAKYDNTHRMSVQSICDVSYLSVNRGVESMQGKIIIALAPTGGWGLGEGNPVSPEEIAEQAHECANAGAAIVHMHARDEGGQLTSDMTCFNRTVELIAASSDILIEASTGGISSMTAVERTFPIANPLAHIGSLNVGSLNFGDKVYQNSVPDIRLWIKLMAERQIKPSIEVFDTGNMDCALHLIEDGLLKPPCNFSFVCNLRWGMPYHPAIISYLRDRVPAGSHWGANLIGSVDFSQHIGVARLGASVVRVGFEDSRHYHGKVAKNNLELVKALRAELETAGFSIASVEEARKLLLG